MHSLKMDIFGGFLLILVTSLNAVTRAEKEGHFVNAWAAEIRGGPTVAKDVALQHGYRMIRALEGISDHYLLERSDTPHRSKRGADFHTRKLADDERVSFVEQQQHRARVKRGYQNQQVIREIMSRDGALNDPDYKNEWYINQEGSKASRRDSARADLRVKNVWKRGISGEGVVCTIIDDGIEGNHSDLVKNYDLAASYDFNDNDNDPSPRYDVTNENKHGTRCAGEIAMMANNNKCGVGIAYNSQIGGIRILDGMVTDHIEAQALAFNRDYIDIYSSSWGPNDDGKTCEGPGRLTGKALEDGVKLGRKGKGSLFVWAAGNGGRSGDNCNADGYTSSIFTISVSSSSQEGKIPYYSERCASTITTAYSSGSSSEGKVISADLHDKCTDSHTGTSAAAPLAAGILALLLEVNKNVTWRDVQHIIIHTSRMGPLAQAPGWYRNGAGYCYNLGFGTGLMDANAIIEAGETWKGVGPQKICRVEPSLTSGFPRNFVSGQSVEIEFNTDGCFGQDNEVNYLEHVQVVADIAHDKRGNIYTELESPSGTITTLMLERKNDVSKSGFKKWPMTSVHNWGEKSKGIFKFRVADRTNDNLKGSIKNAVLILYGTNEQPEHQKHIISQCPELNTYADTLTNVIDIDRDSGSSSSLFNLKQYLSSQTSGPGQNSQSISDLIKTLKG